jgi:hypothetical protein
MFAKLVFYKKRLIFVKKISMAYLVECQTPEALAILENLASLNLLTINKLDNVSEATPESSLLQSSLSADSTSAMAGLKTWAAEANLKPQQKAARTRLIPLLLDYQLLKKSVGDGPYDGSFSKIPESIQQRRAAFAATILKKRDKKLSGQTFIGMLNDETAEKMLQHIEQLRNEWERDF